MTWLRDRASGRATTVAMMQAAEPGESDNLPELRRLDAAVIRRVLAQGQVHSVLVVPVAELAKQAPLSLITVLEGSGFVSDHAM